MNDRVDLTMYSRLERELFNSAHWGASYKGSKPDDADFLPDLLEGVDSEDSNGSELLHYWEDDREQIHCLFAAYGREFVDGSSYEERVYKLVGVQVKLKDWSYLDVQSFEILPLSVDEVYEQVRQGVYPK